MPLALAVVAFVVLLFLPVYVSASGTAGAVVTERSTLLEANGGRILIPLLIPVLITLVISLVRGPVAGPLLLASAIVLTAFCVLTLFSIGIFYAPAALAAIAAAVAQWLRPRPARE